MIELARGLDERRVLIETIEIVFDDLLRCAGLEEAGAALAEAEAAQQAESALAQLHPEIALSRAAWHLARGDAAAAEAAWASAPVSYTHLDVYKRQEESRNAMTIAAEVCCFTSPPVPAQALVPRVVTIARVGRGAYNRSPTARRKAAPRLRDRRLANICA